MQISSNTTGMQAGLCVAADKNARDHCVVVVKGTFVMDGQGEPQLAMAQRPLVFADEHLGGPDKTSIRNECDFALTKPLTDVLVHGHAIAPGGRPVERMYVRLEVQAGRHKDLLVTGERRWERGVIGLKPSAPVPFTRMPIVYERSFGGTDCTHQDPQYHGAELRNPVGVGFRSNPRTNEAVGSLLPNVEDPFHPLAHWNEVQAPVGLGVVGRSWQPRISYAGTYDQRWLDEEFPFLPRNFDPRYFQSAPGDQQLTYLHGGETLRCHGMTTAGVWAVKLPQLRPPVTFRFQDRRVDAQPQMDTVLIDCDAQEVVVGWRASVLLGKKLTHLREIFVGAPPGRLVTAGPVEYRRGKPYFRGLSAVVAWRRRNERRQNT